jgi:hypothetical protein
MKNEPQNNRESGVTLIEILIAVSLLSLLSVGMLVAMRLGFNTMDKTDTRLVKNRRVSNTRGIIESEIDGFVYSLADYRPAPDQMRTIPFLQTEAQSMRFVTSYSLEEGWRGRPRIAEMQVIPGEKNQGVRLIVNETPYTGPDQAGQGILGIEQDPSGPPIIHFAPILPGPQSFVLADRLAYCRFAWLEPLRDPPFQRWRPDWVQPQILPLAVRIEMAPLDSTPTDLHVSTVTVPFHVNLSPGKQYADQP